VSSSLGELSVAGHKVDLLDEITGYRKTICRQVEQEVTKALRSPEVQASVTREIWTSVEKLAAAFQARPISCSIEADVLKVKLAPLGAQ
jgi:hypothetical protein